MAVSRGRLEARAATPAAALALALAVATQAAPGRHGDPGGEGGGRNRPRCPRAGHAPPRAAPAERRAGGGGPGRQTRPRPPLATGRGRGRGGAGEGVGGFAGVGRVWLPALITGKAERGGSRGSQAGLESEPQNQEDLGGRLSGAIQDSRSNEHGQHASLNPWALPPAVLGRAATLRGDKIRFQK